MQLSNIAVDVAELWGLEVNYIVAYTLLAFLVKRHYLVFTLLYVLLTKFCFYT